MTNNTGLKKAELIIKADELEAENKALRDELHKVKNSECVLSLKEQRLIELIRDYPHKLPADAYQKLRRTLKLDT